MSTDDGSADEGACADTSVSTDEARELLVDLVSIPSPSGEEDAAAGRLVEFFAAHGREAYRDAVGNVRAPGDDSVLLTSHVDTVPGEVPVEVEPTEEGDVLWGRGSVDATGPLAAMAAAAVRTGVSFAGVVREETDSAGARHLVADRGPPGAVINGEPGGADAITLGYRGFLPGTYVATSESGHTSRPETNAIQDAMAWWARVEDAFEHDSCVAPPAQRGGGGDSEARSASGRASERSSRAEAAGTPAFEQVTAKPVGVEGGFTADGLSVEATLDVQFRVPPDGTAAEVRERADDLLDAGTVTWGESIPPVIESPRTGVARALRAAIREEGGEPRLVRKTGTSDMNLYADTWDCPMATYGPGDSGLDHAPDERLRLPEFDRAVAVLSRAAADLAGRDGPVGDTGGAEEPTRLASDPGGEGG